MPWPISCFLCPLADARKHLEDLKEDYEKVSQAIASLDQAVSSMQEAHSRAEVSKGSLEGQINVLLEQINTEKMNREHIKAQQHDIAPRRIMELRICKKCVPERIFAGGKPV